MIIEQGLVRVNGETETRKRRKIVGGDTIQLDDITLTITE
jgi:ribosome-associated protein